jgi:hypothetical protein
MVASEAWVGTEGLMYAPFIDRLRQDPSQDGPTAAATMPADSVYEGNEFSFSAIDIEALDDTTAAIDAIARWGLADPAHLDTLAEVRARSRGADTTWWSWYLDIHDFAAQAGVESAVDGVGPLGDALAAGLDRAVLASEAQRTYDYVGGLSFFYVYESLATLADYEGAGATWSRDTDWDELLRAHFSAEHQGSAE